MDVPSSSPNLYFFRGYVPNAAGDAEMYITVHTRARTHTHQNIT